MYKSDSVAVVLCTYNSTQHLCEQLRTILDQKVNDLKVFVVDDHSDTPLDLQSFTDTLNLTDKVSVRRNIDNLGFARNFLSSLKSIGSDFRYYAFSDQDDVWSANKLSKALTVLENYQHDIPVLYCGRTEIVNEDCSTVIGKSPLFEKKPSFANALVQSIGGGNTMVFNKAARDLIVSSSIDVDIVSHDWWCYLIISGAGGVVHYDPAPYLQYRQHSANLSGSNMLLSGKIVRMRGLLSGLFSNWINSNLAALVKNKSTLTLENQRRLDDFISARQSSLIRRIFLFKRSGIYRQTPLENLGMFFGVLLGKV